MDTSTPSESRAYDAVSDFAMSTVQRTGTGRLRCMVVSCVFPPEFTFSATTSASIAEELAARGQEVTVLAPFPSKPAGKLFPGYRRSMYSTRKMPQGYKLVHCFGVLAPKSGMVSRFLENLSFGVTAGLRLLFGERQDVIYSNAWPVFATLMIVSIAKLRGVPVVVSVQDVYPESLVSQVRTHPESLIFRVMRLIDGLIGRSAKALIVISHGFHEIYRTTRGVPSERIHVVHNWGDRKPVNVDSGANAQYREARGLPQEALLAVYAGNIGPAAGVEGIVEAFGKLRDLRNLYLLIAGSGSNLTSCMARASTLGLERVIFHSPWRHEETDAVLGAADLLLLPTIGNQSLASVPSKLISYLLAGQPVLAMVLPESETANMVRRAGAGWIVPPDNPDALAAEIRNIASLPAGELHSLGKSGKAFADENLCRESNLPKVVRILEMAGRAKHLANRAVAAESSR
jgi:colanic acid biosynthesis glycosyl transferase WcaI